MTFFTDDGSRLQAVLHGGRDRTTIVLTGELDLVSGPSLTRLLDTAMSGGTERLDVDMAKLGFVDVAERLLTTAIPVTASGLPIDLVLVAVSASARGRQRGFAAIQAGLGPVDGLAGVPDQSERVIRTSAGALAVLAAPNVDLPVQGVEPAFSVVGFAFSVVGLLLALVRQVFPLVRQALALVREAITAGSSVPWRRRVRDLARLVRAIGIGRSHEPTVRPATTLRNLPGPLVRLRCRRCGGPHG